MVSRGSLILDYPNQLQRSHLVESWARGRGSSERAQEKMGTGGGDQRLRVLGHASRCTSLGRVSKEKGIRRVIGYELDIIMGRPSKKIF